MIKGEMYKCTQCKFVTNKKWNLERYSFRQQRPQGQEPVHFNTELCSDEALRPRRVDEAKPHGASLR